MDPWRTSKRSKFSNLALSESFSLVHEKTAHFIGLDYHPGLLKRSKKMLCKLDSLRGFVQDYQIGWDLVLEELQEQLKGTPVYGTPRGPQCMAVHTVLSMGLQRSVKDRRK